MTTIKTKRTLFILAIIANTCIGQSLSFKSTDAFKEYLLKNVVQSEDDLSIDTLFSFSPEINILVPKDVEISTINNIWPILIFCQSKKGICALELMQTTPTTKVAWGGKEIVSMEKIFNHYQRGTIYIIGVNDSLIEITDEMEGETSCGSKISWYVILLNSDLTTIQNLTPEPIQVKPERDCLNKEIDLTKECKSDTLYIDGNPKTEEQKQWTGKYIIESDRLVRAESLADIIEQMNATHTLALGYFRNKNIQKAIAILTPLLSHSPDNALNEQTVSIYNDFGFFLAESTRYTESLDVLKKVISIFPKRVVAQLNIADVYFELGQKDKAKEHYRVYTEMMIAENKKNKIPPRAIDRAR